MFLACIPFIFEACVYMGFSIIAAVLGGIITIVCSVKIYFITSYGFQNNDNYRTKLAIIVILKINFKNPGNTKRILISKAATACFTGTRATLL